MFNRLLKMPGVQNKPGFSIWHCLICKGYAEFWIYVIMVPNASKRPGYASICGNIPQYAWTLLNVPEYVRTNCSDYARALHMLPYRYKNIIVTNAITLGFLSAWFVHPDTLLTFYLFKKTSLTIKLVKLLKLFFLTTMMLDLSKYLNEQLGVFLDVKQQKWS